MSAGLLVAAVVRTALPAAFAIAALAVVPWALGGVLDLAQAGLVSAPVRAVALVLFITAFVAQVLTRPTGVVVVCLSASGGALALMRWSGSNGTIVGPLVLDVMEDLGRLLLVVAAAVVAIQAQRRRDRWTQVTGALTVAATALWFAAARTLAFPAGAGVWFEVAAYLGAAAVSLQVAQALSTSGSPPPASRSPRT